MVTMDTFLHMTSHDIKTNGCLLMMSPFLWSWLLWHQRKERKQSTEMRRSCHILLFTLPEWFILMYSEVKWFGNTPLTLAKLHRQQWQCKSKRNCCIVTTHSLSWLREEKEGRNKNWRTIISCLQQKITESLSGHQQKNYTLQCNNWNKDCGAGIKPK